MRINGIVGSILLVLTAILLFPAHALAETILVGPDSAIKLPSEAETIAVDGDTIRIEPRKGGYHDCVIWRQNGLKIVGAGGGPAFIGKICEGKGIFVIKGRDTLVDRLSFIGARDTDGNGAGIRQEGTNLLVEHSRFADNEEGILAGSDLSSTVTVIDSSFIGNGSCIVPSGCAHGIYVGQIARLRVIHSFFQNTQHGHHIKSRALKTEIIRNRIADGPTGTSSYLVDIPNGGLVLIRDNKMEKGPKSDNHCCAIAIGLEGVSNPTPYITIFGNRFRNDAPIRTFFVRNATKTPAILEANSFIGPVTGLNGK